MERRKHDPQKELPLPSSYAVSVGYATGDLVVYRGQAMLVSATVEFHSELYPTGIVGRCYILRRNNWLDGVHIIVPVDEIDYPKFYAA